MTGKTIAAQTAMNAGELSPRLMGRTEQARYSYGLKRMRNFVPTLQGPAIKRPGFRFVAEIADSSERCWLWPFIFAQRDAFVLEFGDETVRFYTDDGQVLEAAQTITSMTNASPGVFTKAGHGLSVGDELYIATLPGTSGIAGRNWRVDTAPTADTFTLEDLYGTALNTTSSGTYTGSGTFERIYTLASPYGIDDLTDDDGCCTLSIAQDSDVLYVCVPGFQQRTLTRTSAASWAFSTFQPTDGPFKSVDPDQTITVYIDNGAIGAGRTLTASSSIFTSDHIGGLFLLERKLTEIVGSWEVGKTISTNDLRRSQGHYYKALNNGTTGTITPSHTEGSRFDGEASAAVNWEYQHSGYGWGVITAVASGTSATMQVYSTVPTGATGSGNASTRWAFGDWSEEYGWPTHACIFRERLCFARGTEVWGSVPSLFTSFAQRDAGITALDSAFSVDIRNGRNDAIKWLAEAGDLIAGTEADTRAIGEISTAEALGPGNVTAHTGPGYGVRQVQPAKINDALMVALTSGKNIREVKFTFETDGYSALDRAAFADHIAKGRVIQMAHVQEPDSVIFKACADGGMIALSYQREHDLQAWHQHPLGSACEIESVCAIPAPDASRTQLWACGKLTVNGQTKRYVGFMEADWDGDNDALADMFYVDWGLTYAGSAATTITGAHHLEGMSVQVLADGAYIGDYTVSAGAIDISDQKPDGATKVQLGLGYEAILESMPVGRPGMKARIVRTALRLLNAVGGFFGQIFRAPPRDDETRTSALELRLNSLPLSTATPAFTGVRMAEHDGGDFMREITWIITHNAPTAFTVSSVMAELAVSTERN